MVNLLTTIPSTVSSTRVLFSVQVALAVLSHVPALAAVAIMWKVTFLPGSIRGIIFSPLKSAAKPSWSISVTFTLVALDKPLLITVIVKSISSPMTAVVALLSLIISKET